MVIKPASVVMRGFFLTVCCLVIHGNGMAQNNPGELLKKDLLNIPARMSPKVYSALLLNVGAYQESVWAVGERGILLSSQDAGKTLRQAKVPVAVNLTAVRAVDDKQVWAVGHDGVVLGSQNAGADWQLIFDGRQANKLLLADVKDREQKFKAIADAAAPAKKKDAQAIWDKALRCLEDSEAGVRFGPSRPLLDVYFRNQNEGVVVGAYGQIFRTRDAGKTWESLVARIDNFDSLHYNSVQGDSKDRLVMVGEQGKVYLSSDFGDTWTISDTKYRGHLYGSVINKTADGLWSVIAYGFAGNVFDLTSTSGKKESLEVRGTKVQGTESLTGAAKWADGSIILLDQAGALYKRSVNDSTWTTIGQAPSGLYTGLTITASQQLIASSKGGLKQLLLK